MKPEPFNPFYWLLIVASITFVVTSLPVAIALSGINIQTPPWFQRYDWVILLSEMGAIVLFGLLSMGLDRIRRRPGTGNRSGALATDKATADTSST
jgi:amino acid transporter